MGGILPDQGPESTPPRFAVSVLADPGTPARLGNALDRVQIIKGWTTEDATHEAVYDVASGSPLPSSVDPLTCQPVPGGTQSLCTVWRDPDWDPKQSAFYYVRALEKPSCRWSQKLCVQAGIQCDDPDSIPEGFEACCSTGHRPLIQERAWTSPIWYRPDST